GGGGRGGVARERRGLSLPAAAPDNDRAHGARYARQEGLGPGAQRGKGARQVGELPAGGQRAAAQPMALHCRLRLGPRHSLPDQRAPEWRVRGRGPDRSVRHIRLLRARRGAQRRLTATHPGDHLSVSSPLAIIALRRPTASLGQIRRERPRNEPTARRVYASRGFNWSARAASGRGSRPAEAWAIASPRWYSHFWGSCAEALTIAATAASGRPCCRSQ